jgi:hypothetical protein
MNAFRQWSWTPMFRIAWAVTGTTLGSRFVAFCERRLELPRLNNVRGDREVLVLEEAEARGGGWKPMCDRLLDEGRINHVEHGMLVSAAVCADSGAPDRLVLLRLRWKGILERTAIDAQDTTLGVAVFAANQLRLLRVQDHVRSLGLGGEFVRMLVHRYSVSDRVVVGAGDYGPLGRMSRQEAEHHQARFAAMVGKANRLLREERAKADAAARAVAGAPDPIASGTAREAPGTPA